MALRGETHLAGIHWLDEESGVYNISYLERYLRKWNWCSFTWLKGNSGLMLEEKNKARISSLEDLAGDNIVFVNRQKGAGTRLYLDYMLKKKGINPADITGYGREEYDHLSVAAAVKAGGADTGLGIRAAAEALGLEFIPLTRESYELAVPASFYNTPKCRALLEVIGSDAFRNAVEKMGGYDLTRSGEIVWRSHPDKS